jgi:hypothetical protein
VQGGGDHEHIADDKAPSRDPSVASSDLDADHDEQLPVHARRLSDILAAERQLCVVSSNEPASLVEAQADHCWKMATEEVMVSIEDNKTWTLYDLPQGIE